VLLLLADISKKGCVTMAAYSLTLADIIAAQRRIAPYVAKTPFLFSAPLQRETGAHCWLKMESLQYTGSFKLRGAANNILSLSVTQQHKGVITASAGNHSQAVAYIAHKLGCPATVVVPKGTPRNKIAKLQPYGCETIVYGDSFGQAQDHAEKLCEERGLTFVHAYLAPATIAGQGTATLEALWENPDFDVLLVPAGGGGLMLGAAVAAKSINPNIRVIGVQTAASPPWFYSFRDKRLNNDVPFGESIAEGLYGLIEEPNISESFGIVDEILLVDEDTVRRAMHFLLWKHGIVVEASGAVSVSALLENTPRFAEKKVACLVSGGNVEPELLKSIL